MREKWMRFLGEVNTEKVCLIEGDAPKQGADALHLSGAQAELVLWHLTSDMTLPADGKAFAKTLAQLLGELPQGGRLALFWDNPFSVHAFCGGFFPDAITQNGVKGATDRHIADMMSGATGLYSADMDDGMDSLHSAEVDDATDGLHSADADDGTDNLHSADLDGGTDSLYSIDRQTDIRTALSYANMKEMLRRALAESGMENAAVRWFYPYPSVLFATHIFSDERLPRPGECEDNDDNFRYARLESFDEKKTIDAIVQAGLYPQLAHAYFVVIGKNAMGPLPDFARFSVQRRQERQIITHVYHDHVEKIAFHEKARAHVLAVARWEAPLNAWLDGVTVLGKRLTMNHVSYVKEQEGCVGFAFALGKSMEQILDEMLAQGRGQQVCDVLLDFCAVVREKADRPFVQTEEFTDIFGRYSKQENNESKSLPVTDIDLVCQNILITDNSAEVIDYEWTFDFPVPVDFYIYRFLYLYLEAKNRAPFDADITNQIYERAGITQEMRRELSQMETHFQHYVQRGAYVLRNAFEEEGAPVLRASYLQKQLRNMEKKALHVTYRGFSSDESMLDDGKILDSGKAADNERILAEGKVPDGERISADRKVQDGERISADRKVPDSERISDNRKVPDDRKIADEESIPDGGKILYGSRDDEGIRRFFIPAFKNQSMPKQMELSLTGCDKDSLLRIGMLRQKDGESSPCAFETNAVRLGGLVYLCQGALSLVVKNPAENENFLLSIEEINCSQDAAEELKRRIADLTFLVENREQQLSQMRESASWKITAPLRRLRGQEQ